MRLRELRQQKGATQKTIADYLHIRQNTYSQYENNKRQVPICALVNMARFYGVSVDYLLDLTDVETPYAPSETYEKLYQMQE